MKLEFQILVLLFASLAALAVHHFVQRTESIDFHDGQWVLGTTHSGGGAAASLLRTDRGLEVSCKVTNDSPNPFAGATFSYLDGAGSANLDWVSQYRIKAYVEGEAPCYFRCFLRNKIPEILDPSDIGSRQCSEFAFKLSNEPQTVVIDRDRFHVPSWWAEKYAKDFSHSIPKFDRVNAIELFTGNSVRCDNLKLIVEEIELQGPWLAPAILNRVLLASWLTIGLGVVLQWSVEVRRKLRQSGERETRLRLINVSLESQACKLTKLANLDSLTGLFNRTGLRHHPKLSPEVIRSTTPVSLIIFDIDHFKLINDSRGHNFGDEVLADVGEILYEETSSDELVARWGGEEFLVVCFESTELISCGRAESLRSLIETEIGVTCSFGVCEIEEGETFLESLDRADRAMYHAKYSGRNKVVAFSHLPENEKKQQQDREPNGEVVEAANI